MNRIKLSDLAHIGQGFMIGGVDIIPGVSGGTIALILGIYERLITAISRFDSHLISLVARRQWRAASEHVDLRFLVAVGLGIVSGIVCLAQLMLYLLLEHRTYTLSVFFGFILASGMIVARMVQPPTTAKMWQCLALAVAAGFLAFGVVGLGQAHFVEHPLYFFLCGAIAICAMILPGISGAYILWLLGAYAAVTSLLEGMLRLRLTSEEAIYLMVFVIGCAFGLVSFSKLLRWLLARAHSATMAALAGFMVGSLRGIWPFQTDITPETNRLKLKRYELFVPENWDTQVTVCVLLGIAALVITLLLEHWGRHSRFSDHEKHS